MLTRRDFLEQGVVLAIGLTAEVSLPPILHADEAPGHPYSDLYLTIRDDNSLQFICPNVEMGQGVYTSLVTIFAEPLNTTPSKFEQIFAPASRDFNMPTLNLQITGGSSSVSGRFAPLTEAGSRLGWWLQRAGARHWNCRAEDVRLEEAMVLGPQAEQHLSFAEAAKVANGIEWQPAPVRPASPRRFIGTSVPRLDLREKVTGAPIYGIDAGPADALIAVVIRPSEIGARVGSYDATRALEIKGVVQIFPIFSGLAIVGTRYWILRKARELVTINWESGPHADQSDATIMADLTISLKDASTVHSSGQGKNRAEIAKGKGQKTLQSSYYFPYLAHATMEPQNCVARVSDSDCEIWAPTQSPTLAQEAAMALTGLKASAVKVHQTFLGGGFGRRLEQDYVKEAVAIAEASKKTVKLMWSREDDMTHDFYRPCSVHELSAFFNEQGKATGWDHAIASPSILEFMVASWVPAMVPGGMPQFLKRTGGKLAHAFLSFSGKDDTAVEGAADQPYQFADTHVSYAMYKKGLPVGFWRSVGHSYTACAVECFIDEICHEEKADPIQWRRERLPADHPRQKILEVLSESNDWKGPLAANQFRGMAVHSCFGSHAGQVVTIEWKDKKLKVVKVLVVLDCGLLVNPDQVTAQMESAVIFGLSAALYGDITLVNGKVHETNFDTYSVLRMQDCPVIEVTFIPGGEKPTGVGEPGVPPVAPALLNAFFQASTQRIRKLPLLKQMES